MKKNNKLHETNKPTALTDEQMENVNGGGTDFPLNPPQSSSSDIVLNQQQSSSDIVLNQQQSGSGSIVLNAQNKPTT